MRRKLWKIKCHQPYSILLTCRFTPKRIASSKPNILAMSFAGSNVSLRIAPWKMLRRTMRKPRSKGLWKEKATTKKSMKQKGRMQIETGSKKSNKKGKIKKSKSMIKKKRQLELNSKIDRIKM